MKTKMKNWVLVLGAGVILAGLGLAGDLRGQQSADLTGTETRIVEDTGLKLVNRRPKSKSKPTAPRRYRLVSNLSGSRLGAQAAELGVTLWRLRPATSKDDQSIRFLDQGSDAEGGNGSASGLMPERVSADTTLQEGDRLRLSIEAGQTGYLYIIDREQFDDGTLGEPFLIFPNTQTHGGNNRLEAGSVIEIPGQNDRNSFFKIRLRETGTGKRLAGDVLTLIYTSQPLTGFELPKRTLKITPEQFAAWEKWKVPTEKFDLEDGAGQAYTRVEKLAGANPLRFLEQGDPVPQTLFRIAAKPGASFVVTLPLVVGMKLQ